ncbi:MAG: hypothetical protein HQL54_12580 [Magnetococcales bacterium]|nr:hypothetical protein [Magnetococcales bacterium]
MNVIAIISIWFTIWTGLGLLFFFKAIRANWREPVFHHPILIFESDDWGPGPTEHADALNKLSKTLSGYHDKSGQHPCFTLALQLTAPDPKQPLTTSGNQLNRIDLSHPDQAPVLSAINAGVADKTFSLHLHGLEHFRAETLLEHANQKEGIFHWLTSRAETESLPPMLQTRWNPIAHHDQTRQARVDTKSAYDEAKLFEKIFSHPAQVAVPPCFVWNPNVEQGWQKAGISVVVTPGCRFDQRRDDGTLSRVSGAIHTGDLSPTGLLYLVRDRYFEPYLGHTAEDGLHALSEKTAQGRPTLLETHRANFIRSAEHNQHALEHLKIILTEAQKKWPELRFTNTWNLAQAIRTGDPQWICFDTIRRIRIWWHRMESVPRWRKWLLVSGWWLVSRLMKEKI